MNYLKYFTLVFLLFFVFKTSQAEKLRWQVLNRDSKETPSNTVQSNQSSAIATDSAKPTANFSTHNNCAFSLIRLFTNRDYGKYDPIKAVIDGDLERVRSLAARGANFNIQDGFMASRISSYSRVPSWTPLMYAVYMNDLEMTELLIELGVNVNSQNKNNMTALMLASRHSLLPLVRTLLNPKFGVATHLRDNTGKTAFLHAVDAGRSDIANFLLVNHLKVAAENHDDLMRETIIKDASAALRLAAYHNYIDIIKFLVKNVPDIDINARSEAGWTAFMTARFYHHTEITDFLSQKTGMKFTQRDHQTIDNAEIERNLHRYSNDKTGIMFIDRTTY